MRQTIQKILSEISGVNVAVYAANAAFFLLLSLFPALLFLLSITQYTVISVDGVVSFFLPILPDVLLPLAEFVLNDLAAANPVSIVSVSAILLLWSASKGVYGLVKGLNRANHLKETRPYWKVRLICVFYTAAVLGSLLGTAALYSVSQTFLETVFVRPSPIYLLFSTLLRLRLFVLSVLLVSVFSAIYMVFPCRKSHWKQVLPGSLAGSAGWIVFSWLFSWYMKTVGDSSAVYGSISAIALAMLWVYSCMCILFFGAMLNHYLQCHRNTLRDWFHST